jgi:hypothetical protein
VLSLLGNTIAYLPSATNNAADTFIYTLSDGLLSVTGTVEVVVDPPPDTPTQNITGTAVIAGGAVQITAAGIPGRSYQIQMADSLNAPISWSNLGSPQVAAANGQVQFTDPTPAAPRFYRVVEP